jgi:membrane protein implicated in regulation of membrane protease activity
MPAWALWIAVAVAMFATEAVTVSFVTFFFGVGALLAAALAAAGLGLAPQLAGFAVAAVASMYVLRPWLVRLADRGPRLRTGVDAMRGQIGVVTKAIGELEPGLVRVGGDTWTARSYYDHEEIPQGRRVEVVEIRGVTALVIEAPGAHRIGAGGVEED